jgi:hypothetical protein
VTFFTEVNAISFLSLCKEIVERLLFFVIAEGADESINSPLKSAIGTEEIPFSNFFLQ